MGFSLGERLADAAEQRRIAAGLPSHRRPEEVQPPPPEPVVAPPRHDAEQALADLVVDLRDPTSVLEYTPLLEAPPTDPEPSPLFATSAPALPVWQGGAQRAGALTQQQGSPRDQRTACPNCGGGPVRLDMFDLVGAVAHVSCVKCGFEFQTKRPPS